MAIPGDACLSSEERQTFTVRDAKAIPAAAAGKEAARLARRNQGEAAGPAQVKRIRRTGS